MIREATGMDISKMAELYEEYHLLRCKNRPKIYTVPPEDSFYFNDLSERLLYGDEEIVLSEDDESGVLNGFCIFEEITPEGVLRRKKKYCRINLLIIRRGFSDKGIDSGLIEYVRNIAAENECEHVEYFAETDAEAIICGDNGFEPEQTVMCFRLK